MQEFFGYRVELLEHSEECTIVLVDKPLSVGAHLPVKVTNPQGRTPAVPLVVTSCRETDYGGFVITGKFLIEHPDLSQAQLPPKLDAKAKVRKDSRLRSVPRASCDLCVISSDLPGFRGRAVDLSDRGLQVEVQAPLALETSVLMRLEFDSHDFLDIEATASVVWCEPSEKNGVYCLGLEFRTLSSEAQLTLSRYGKRVKAHQTHGASLKIEPERAGRHELEPIEQIQVLETQEISLPAHTYVRGYLQTESLLKLRLRMGVGGLIRRDFSFEGFSGLADELGLERESQLLTHMRTSQLDSGLTRYQFLGADSSILLEIEAQSYSESLSEVN